MLCGLSLLFNLVHHCIYTLNYNPFIIILKNVRVFPQSLQFRDVWLNSSWMPVDLPHLACLFLTDRKDSSSSAPTKFEVQVLAQFDSHNSQVWRVSWNITSTLLASSGDDGCVRLWKGEFEITNSEYMLLLE